MKVQKKITSINVGPPGTKLQLYGNTFVVQDDGNLIADIHQYTAECGIKAGWFTAYEEPKDELDEQLETKKEELEVTKTEFGYDIGNYYGAGDLEKLRLKIEACRAWEVKDFAKTRLKIRVPTNIKPENLVKLVIREIVKQELKEGDE